MKRVEQSSGKSFIEKRFGVDTVAKQLVENFKDEKVTVSEIKKFLGDSMDVRGFDKQRVHKLNGEKTPVVLNTNKADSKTTEALEPGANE